MLNCWCGPQKITLRATIGPRWPSGDPWPKLRDQWLALTLEELQVWTVQLHVSAKIQPLWTMSIRKQHRNRHLIRLSLRYFAKKKTMTFPKYAQMVETCLFKKQSKNKSLNQAMSMTKLFHFLLLNVKFSEMCGYFCKEVCLHFNVCRKHLNMSYMVFTLKSCRACS